MHQNNRRIAELIVKYSRKELLPDDAAELMEWRRLSTENEAFFLKYSNEKRIVEEMELRERFERETKGWGAIMSRIRRNRLKMRKITFFRYAAAAVFLFGIAISYLYFRNTKTSNTGLELRQNIATQDVLPGGNKAMLTLANGTRIILDSVANGTIAQQGNTKVLKLNSGQLTYNTFDERPVPINYNTLTTPRAGQYQVTLPDGTKVWLNNASSLRYPTNFTGAERVVQLTGEAYFEVASIYLPAEKGRGKTKMPFFVDVLPSSGNPVSSRVKVLGTHFNVMAYSDEQSVKTTLLEGSVEVIQGSKEVVIRPGEQALVFDDKKSKSQQDIQVKSDVDVLKVVAWKDGYFSFENADVATVMRQLARWYDVEISYEGVLTTHHFDGQIQRNLLLSQLLENIQTKGVHFKIEGRKIKVTP